MSNQEQRAERRLPKCVVAAKPDACDIISKVLRVTNPCDPTRADPCTLIGFELPAPLPPVPDAGPGAMQVIVVGNSEESGSCGGNLYPSVDRPGSTNSGGCFPPIEVVVPASTYTLKVSLTVIPGLTNADRYRIIALGDVQHLLHADVPTLVSTLLVSSAQAQALRTALDDASLNVTALAQSEIYATLLSDCAWYSSELQSPCATGQKPVPPYLTIPCGAYSSKVSQADAENQALEFVLQTKVCFWENDEVTVACDEGFSEQRTTPSAGLVVVPAGSFRSDVSKADANAQAQAYGATQLNCIYGNAESHRCQCTLPGQVNGSPTVAAQTVFSSVSVSDADTQAEALALELCDCYWCSQSYSSGCPDQVVWYSPAQDAFFAANTDGSNPTGDPCAQSVTLHPRSSSGSTSDPCAFRSYVSQADADAQAAAATPSAICTYANCGIGARCAPVGGVETPGCVDYSEDIGPNIFVASDAVSACNQALAISKIPSRFRPSYANGSTGPYVQPRNIRCCYESEEVTVTCASEETRLPSKDPVVYDPDTTWCPPTPIPEDAIGKYDGTESALGLTEASRGRFVTLPTATITRCNAYTYAADCSFTVKGPEPTDYWRGEECGTGPVAGYASQTMVDELAFDNAMGSLTCEFSSQPAKVYCGFTSNPTTGEITDDGSSTAGNFDPDAIGGIDHAIQVDRGQFVSFTSMKEANLLRNTYLRSLQDCFYSNARIQLSCVSGDSAQTFIDTAYPDSWSGLIAYGNDEVAEGQLVHDLSVRGLVEARTFRSYLSQVIANRMGQREAVSQLDCFYLNTTVNMLCDTKATVTSWKTANYLQRDTTIALGSGNVFGVQPVDKEASGSEARPVVIDSGAFISRVSQVLANRQAVLIGVSLLDCYYSNGRVEMRCAPATEVSSWISSPPDTNEDTPIIRGEAFLEPTYKVYSESTGSDIKPVLIPQRYARSYVSQIEANRVAITTAAGLLDCYYVNPKIDVYCGRYSRAYMLGLNPPVDPDSADASVTRHINGNDEPAPGYAPSPCDSSEYIPSTDLLPEVAHNGGLAFSLPKGVVRDYQSWTTVNLIATKLATDSTVCSYSNTEQKCACWWDYWAWGKVNVHENGYMEVVFPPKSVYSANSSLEAATTAAAINSTLWRQRMDLEGTDCQGNARPFRASAINIMTNGGGCSVQLDPAGMVAASAEGHVTTLSGGKLGITAAGGTTDSTPVFGLDGPCLLTGKPVTHAPVSIGPSRTCFALPVRHLIKVNDGTSNDSDPGVGEYEERTEAGVGGEDYGSCPCDLKSLTVQHVTLLIYYKYLCITGLLDINAGAGGGEMSPPSETGVLTPPGPGSQDGESFCTSASKGCSVLPL